MCISKDLLTEYFDVLHRQKFRRFPDFIHKATLILKDIQEHGVNYDPQEKLHIIKDPDDNILLELALESDADFLITGNSNDFTINIYENTKIVSPKEYWELYR